MWEGLPPTQEPGSQEPGCPIHRVFVSRDGWDIRAKHEPPSFLYKSVISTEAAQKYRAA
jgi:hypothetical protein